METLRAVRSSIPNITNKKKPSSFRRRGFFVPLLASSPAQARKAVNDKGGDMGNDDVDGKQDNHECVAEGG